MFQFVILTGIRQPLAVTWILLWCPDLYSILITKTLQVTWSLSVPQLETLNLRILYIIHIYAILVKYENENFRFLPVRQNSEGCLMPVRITNWNT